MLTHPTILLVEDNEDDVLLVKRAFKKAQITCSMSIATTGEAAIEYLEGEGEYADREKHPIPRIVLLDLKLPRKNGFEVLTWLRAQPELKRLPVIVLTTSREESDLRQAYDKGANSYLVKPSGLENTALLMKTLEAYWLQFNEPAPFDIR